jgi:hypothetical protein
MMFTWEVVNTPSTQICTDPSREVYVVLAFR